MHCDVDQEERFPPDNVINVPQGMSILVTASSVVSILDIHQQVHSSTNAKCVTEACTRDIESTVVLSYGMFGGGKKALV